MDELRSNLTAVAERGTPVGSEAMIERVEIAMSGDTVITINEASSSSPGVRRSAVWGMAAALSLIMVSVLYWAVADSEVYFESAGSPAGSPEALFPERLATIDAMITAHNTGDFETFRSYFSEEPNLFGSPALDDADWEWQRSLMAAGEHWEITGSCEIRGRALIKCPLRMENDFVTPAGIWFESPSFLVGFDPEGAIRTVGTITETATGSPEEYVSAFVSWLENTHPEVHRSLAPGVDGSWVPSPDDVPHLLRYVDEFLEYSDVYPLSP